MTSVGRCTLASVRLFLRKKKLKIMLYDCADIQVNITQRGFIIILIIILFILILKKCLRFRKLLKEPWAAGPTPAGANTDAGPGLCLPRASHTLPLRTETAIPLSSRVAAWWRWGGRGSPQPRLQPGPLQRALCAWLSLWRQRAA